MSEEIKKIESIIKNFKRSGDQLNRPFESDSELFKLGEEIYSINIDEYDPREDYFCDEDPYLLGKNLINATLSDIIATGGEPKFFVHSMNIDSTKDDFFLSELSKGLSKALDSAGCFLLGGDFSSSESWKYTGVAIGKNDFVIKRTSIINDTIVYSTGKFGTGNRQALILSMFAKDKIKLPEDIKKLLKVEFIFRIKESRIIRKYASFCIDSSDGYLNSFSCLKKVNPDLEFQIKMDPLLVDEKSLQLCNKMGFPPLSMLCASAGEYELIFGIPVEKVFEFEREMNENNLSFLKIGKTQAGKEILIDMNGKLRPLPTSLPDPRAINIDQYLREIIDLCKALTK